MGLVSFRLVALLPLPAIICVIDFPVYRDNCPPIRIRYCSRSAFCFGIGSPFCPKEPLEKPYVSLVQSLARGLCGQFGLIGYSLAAPRQAAGDQNERPSMGQHSSLSGKLAGRRMFCFKRFPPIKIECNLTSLMESRVSLSGKKVGFDGFIEFNLWITILLYRTFVRISIRLLSKVFRKTAAIFSCIRV